MAEEPVKANENANTFVNFKEFVNKRYPSGLLEADWEEILSEVS